MHYILFAAWRERLERKRKNGIIVKETGREGKKRDMNEGEKGRKEWRRKNI